MSEYSKMTLSQKLICLREHSNLSREDIAAILVISEQNVMQMENGAHVSAEKLQQLSILYEVPVSILCTDSNLNFDNIPHVYNKAKKVVKILNYVTPYIMAKESR